MGNWWTNRAHLLAPDGVPTVFVAAWNATDMEKRCADVVCDGRDDQDTIMEAMATAHRANKRPRCGSAPETPVHRLHRPVPRPTRSPASDRRLERTS